MGKVHLGLDDLSAYADGELEPAEAREARAHLDACGRCSAELASLARLDHALTATPPVTCAGSLDLRSALLDGQLTAAEAAIARGHIEGCRDCGAEEIVWLASQQALRMLPAALPSARVDAAMRRLVEGGARRPAFPGLGGLVPGAGLRVGLAAALVLAIVVGLVPTGPGPEQAQAPTPDQVLVSSAQLVLYAPTNTFYVLQQQQAAVDAVDATTYALRAHIAVGGKPTALALDPVASRILVLDAGRKSLIEIDPASNSVVKSTPVQVSGTPTSVRADPTTGKVFVFAAREPGQGARGGPRPTPGGSGGGEVAVLDTQRKLEVIRSVEVAPRQVITDPEGNGALFVSTSGTTLVDSSYQPKRSLPGGVGAAYGASGWIAVLGEAGTDAVLHLFGDGAPQPLRLTGIPLAVTSMPEGGFAVLLGSGSGNGRIVVIDGAGAAVGTTPVDQVGRDLTYDPKAKRFAILTANSIVAAALPLGITMPEPSARPSIPVAAIPSVPITAEPSASASPSATPGPLASSSPAAPVAGSPQPSPSAPVVPPSAEKVSEGLYRLANSSGRLPLVTAVTPTRLWFVDQDRLLTAMDLLSGRVFTVAELGRDAEISALAASPSHVYALDARKGELLVFGLQDERLTKVKLPLPGATAIGVAPDGTAWIGGDDGGATLLSLNPLTGRGEHVPLGIRRALSVAPDVGGRIWFSDGANLLGYYDPVAKRLEHLAHPGRGSASVLLPDLIGTLWVGTTAGEIFAVENGAARLVRDVGRPVTSLALGPGGRPWYLAAGVAGSTFAPVERDVARSVPGPAGALAVNPRGRAWIVEASGSGFYLALELGQ